MGRHAKIRASYNADAQYLTRLVAAVEADPKRPSAWKREVTTGLNSVIVLFLQDVKQQIEAKLGNDGKLKAAR